MEKEIFFSKKEIIESLSLKDPRDLFFCADRLSQKLFDNKVYIRGIIEPTNFCQKNCFYCALRKERQISRYKMMKEEIVDLAFCAYQKGYGSIVIQTGENKSQENINFFVDVVRRVSQKTSGKLGITLSLGELSKEAYLQLFEAGASRYLLRIESSSQKLYENIHPHDHLFDERLRALEDLKEIGYQVGSGVMIGLPFQTIDDLAEDLLFFKKFDFDMIGMGPYIPHIDTPLYLYRDRIILKDVFNLSLKMIAIARLLLNDVNIAATTALDVLDPKGREKALLCGANVIMPICTPLKYRKDYKLYVNNFLGYKNAEDCLNRLNLRLKGINKEMIFYHLGDPFHYFSRRKKEDAHKQI